MVEKYGKKKADGEGEGGWVEETVEDMRGKYEKVAEGKEKIGQFKSRADEKSSEARKHLGEKMKVGKTFVGDNEFLVMTEHDIFWGISIIIVG